MLDLDKYSRRAEADPGFKQRLVQNANQAIKNEFGEDLPYKVKCHEKLVFEIEPMSDLADADFEGVAGGVTERGYHTYDTNSRAASKYRRAYGFNSEPTQVSLFGEPGPKPGRTVDPFIRSNDGSWNEEHNHYWNMRQTGFMY